MTKVCSIRTRQTDASFQSVKGVRVLRDPEIGIIIRIQAFDYAPSVLDGQRAFLCDESRPNDALVGSLRMILKESARGTEFRYQFVPDDPSAADQIAFEGLNQWSRITHLVFQTEQGEYRAPNDFDIRRCHKIVSF